MAKRWLKALVGAAFGYVPKLAGGLLLTPLVPSNRHDGTAAAMGGAFVRGPLVVFLGVIMALARRGSRRDEG